MFCLHFLVLYFLHQLSSQTLIFPLLPYICLQETAVERANEVFAALDLNEDGTLDEQEFVEGCMKDQSLAQLLNTGSTQLAEADTGDKK